MLALRKKLTPAEEAAKQVEIANEIQRQRDAENQRIRDLTAENARRRQQIWAGQEQAREDRRMAAHAEQMQREREKRDKQREQQALIDQQKMDEYKAAAAAVAAIKQEITGLRNQPAPDCTTAEGVRLAGEREGQIVGLTAALERADARLLSAERATGRHRAGRA